MMFKVMLESIKFNEKLCVLIEMAEGGYMPPDNHAHLKSQVHRGGGGHFSYLSCLDSI